MYFTPPSGKGLPSSPAASLDAPGKGLTLGMILGAHERGLQKGRKPGAEFSERYEATGRIAKHIAVSVNIASQIRNRNVSATDAAEG